MNNTLKEIIIAYRGVINDRYQFDHLSEKFDLPPSFDKEKVDQFRAYFLEFLYPHPDQRAELNEAFESLDDYIAHPEKLLRVLLDSAGLIFKYGRHLPKILIAGLKAMQSFKKASNFEYKLVDSALKKGFKAPFSKEDINDLLISLSKEDISDFMETTHALFETLHDQKLVKKIIEIVEHLIGKMKKRPNIYSEKEVKALGIGRDIIKEGNALFSQLNREEQEQILNTTLSIEQQFIKELFDKSDVG